MSEFVHLHTEDGLGVSLRKSLIHVIEQRPDGTTMIFMEDGQWRTVEERYVDVVGFITGEPQL